jgi:F-type H+-transporting ATPase subunit c
MKRMTIVWAFAVIAAMMVFFAGPAAAADETGPAAQEAAVAPGGATLGHGLAALAAGLVVLGGGFGIAYIGGSAVQSIARQPEAGGTIFQNMIISAALIEGATLFAVVVTMLAVLK